MSIAQNPEAMKEIEKVSKKYDSKLENNIVVRDSGKFIVKINGKYVLLSLGVNKGQEVSIGDLNELKNDLNAVLKKVNVENSMLKISLDKEIGSIARKYIK